MKKKTHTYCPLFKVIDWINQSLSSSPICEKKTKVFADKRERERDAQTEKLDMHMKIAKR